MCRRQGQEVVVYDGRPNGELLLATGVVEDGNLSDCLSITVELVSADRMYTMKKQILESLGFEPRQVRRLWMYIFLSCMP